ncbi:hypothetical protein ACLB2K_011517 [Fragaria x ananassa]
MVESLDCLHWKWNNCTTGWAEQCRGYSVEATRCCVDLWMLSCDLSAPMIFGAEVSVCVVAGLSFSVIGGIDLGCGGERPAFSRQCSRRI